MVDGLAQAVGQENLVVVVNTGDDGDFYGLRVCPDLDICTYTLAGVVDERGWGYVSDTFRCIEGLATYGQEAWFGLGDRDLATHIHRTRRLAEGWTLSQIADEIAERLGVRARIRPMCDQPVRSVITTPTGPKRFQEFLVRDGAREQIESIELDGIDDARPPEGLLDEIASADVIVIAPSSPIVSIGTILGVAGVRDAVAARRDRTIAVSPIVGGRPVEGPADKFLAGAGIDECSARVMAELYRDVAGTFVFHHTEGDTTADAIESLGVRAVAGDILMPNRTERARLARDVLEAIA